LRVRPHRVFRREGRDLVLDVPIHVREAVRGAQIEVPTLDGRVSVHVPPGTSSGTRLRLKGKGVPDPKGGKPGDLFARIQIRVPKDVSEKALAAIDGLSAFEDPDLRKELFG
jgi:DnaJ-class molecular chaperone